MGKVRQKKLTPNQKKIYQADLLYEKRIARLKKEGYVFPYYLTKPTHPKRITKEYVENYTQNVTRKNLMSYAIGKRYNVSKRRDPSGKYTKLLNAPPGVNKGKGTKEEKLELTAKRQFLNSIRGKGIIPLEFINEDAVIEHEKLLRSLDYNPHDHPRTPQWQTKTEDYITYNTIIRQLEALDTGNNFASWLLKVIKKDIEVANISPVEINSALASMQGSGYVITMEMLYDQQETGEYARQLISRLPLSMEDSSNLYNMVDEFANFGVYDG